MHVISKFENYQYYQVALEINILRVSCSFTTARAPSQVHILDKSTT